MFDQKKFEEAFENKKDYFSIITQILFIYNCRISEVLSACWCNFHKDRFLILVGVKGSANIIITDRKLLNLISELPYTDKQKIFPFVSYYQVYHHLKSNYSHLFKDIKIKKNRKITHAFRYLNLKNIDNDKFIKDILHHNSRRSGKYYKNKLKGS
jgi:predicted nucleic acid-binding protein